MKMQDIFSEKLKDINVPDEEVKAIKKLASDFIFLLEKKGLKAFVGGSFAKGTFIKKEEYRSAFSGVSSYGLQDVDIFIVFETEREIINLGKILKKIKLPGTLKLVHGSRDYFQILTPIAKIELIPTVEVKSPEEAQNVTDVSLSHVKYVSGMIKKNKKLSDEIKLAKAFCSAQRCYGAESYIKGFSGYSLEILVIHFGSFNNFLKGIVKMGNGGKNRVIDSEKYFKNEKQVLFELNASKLQGPLVVIDPTYKYRNVCGGLGYESFEKFKNVVKQFLKKPSLDFFVRRGINIDELKSFALKHKAVLFEVALRTDRQEGDIAGTKCKKFLDFFVDELMRNDQEVVREEYDYFGGGKKAVGYLVVKERGIIEICGPPLSMTESVMGFKKEHKETYTKKGKIWAKKKVSVNGIFNYANRIKSEMGAWGEKIVKL